MLYLCMEVAGCPTVCRHCWAQGSGYGVMPLADIEWALEQAHRFCDGRGVGFDAYPMHEVAAHPGAARLFGLFNSHSGTVRGCADGRAGTMFEPLTTTGVPLAVRDDWRDVLRAAAGTGTLNIWTAFHGAGEVHDRQAGRRGAFAETCRGIERARAMGVSVGCNVFLTTASLPQLDELAQPLRQRRQFVLTKVQRLQLRELAQRLRQRRQLVAGEVQRLQLRELAQRLWQRRQLVAGEVQRLQLGELTQRLRQCRQSVVGEV